MFPFNILFPKFVQVKEICHVIDQRNASEHISKWHKWSAKECKYEYHNDCDKLHTNEDKVSHFLDEVVNKDVWLEFLQVESLTKEILITVIDCKFLLIISKLLIIFDFGLIIFSLFCVILLLDLNLWVFNECIFKSLCLTEADLQVIGINGVTETEEIDCQQGKIEEIKPDVVNLPNININTEEHGPVKVIEKETWLEEPREGKLSIWNVGAVCVCWDFSVDDELDWS